MIHVNIYCREIGDGDTRQAVQFLRELYLTYDLDEETFGTTFLKVSDLCIVREWAKFKKDTANTCKLRIDKLHTRISKKFSVATPPVRLQFFNSK
jgi:hypothetical protein